MRIFHVFGAIKDYLTKLLPINLSHMYIHVHTHTSFVLNNCLHITETIWFVSFLGSFYLISLMSHVASHKLYQLLKQTKLRANFHMQAQLKTCTQASVVKKSNNKDIITYIAHLLNVNYRNI